jgi:hypothetical protein
MINAGTVAGEGVRGKFHVDFRIDAAHKIFLSPVGSIWFEESKTSVEEPSNILYVI